MTEHKPDEFGHLAFVEEIKLRGLVISHTADLEDLLLRIILVCIAEKEEAVRQFKKCTLEGKIAMVKRDLKLYQLEKSNKYKTSISKLNKINAFRNLFAHCKIQWDKKEKELGWFNLLTITIIEGVERAKPVKMTRDEFDAKLEIIREVILDLGELYYELQVQFNLTPPGFYKLD